MPFTSSIMVLVAMLLVGATTVLASPIATPYSQPASTSVSNSTCPTTVITYPTPVYGPTSTLFAHTSTITSEYDCHGCEGLVVEQLGHVFPDIRISYTTTVTEYQPTTYIQAVCSSTSGNVQTESVTVSMTEIAGYATVTVASKTGDMGVRDLLLETKSKPLSTPAAKRSGDFGDGHNPTRCVDYRTGKPIPGCNTAREVDEEHPPLGSIYPAPCWNPITGLFDFAQPGCKITSRSQMDGDAIGLLPPLGLPNATEVEIAKASLDGAESTFHHPQTDNVQECFDSCKASIEIENPPVTVAKLAACDIPCLNLKTCRKTTCITAKRVVDVEIEKRQTSGCVQCPADGSECISVTCPATHKCVECPADGSECFEVDCPPAKRAVDEQIQERQNPQCLVCPANSDDACFEVDCPADAAGRGGDEGQGDKRGNTPTRCYSTCIIHFSKPTYKEIHRCRLDCGLGPQCAGDDCVVVKRAAAVEAEDAARQDSLYGRPAEHQVEGCRFDGMAIVCSS